MLLIHITVVELIGSHAGFSIDVVRTDICMIQSAELLPVIVFGYAFSLVLIVQPTVYVIGFIIFTVYFEE
jgi:hypothetical protein